MREVIFFEAKARNRRVSIVYADRQGDPAFLLRSKRLVDRKKRQITSTEAIFSPESFAIITQLIELLQMTSEYNATINRAHGRIKRGGGVAVNTNAEEFTEENAE